MTRKQATLNYYGGKISRSFWARVTALEGQPDHDLIYVLGCLLQDVEGRVEQLLKLAESQAKPTTKRKRDVT